MPRPEAPRIALVPEPAPGWMAEAISDGGGHIVPLAEAEAIVWADPRDPDTLANLLPEAPHARWVQLPFAGIENFIHLIDHDREWTAGKGVYAEPVAELALALAVAGMRGLGTYARASSWEPPQGVNLLNGRVTILGGGGITRVPGAAAPAVELPHHRGPPPRERSRRRRRRAGGRPLRRRPPRCRPRGASRSR